MKINVAMKSVFLKLLIKLSKQRVLIPFYHAVSANELDFTKNLYTPRKSKYFERDLDVLLEFYEPISLQKLIELSNSKKKINKNYFHLTFDDGLANFYDIVAPILLKRNIPATVFVNTNFIDNKELFYRYKASLLLNFYAVSSEKNKELFYDFIGLENNSTEKVSAFLLGIKFKNKLELDKLAKVVGFSFDNILKKDQVYLSKDQIKELISKGFTIGAHSLNHPYYNEIDFKDQLIQTSQSITYLKKHFNLSYGAFSFPFTDYGVTNNFFKSIDDSIDISFGTSGIKVDKQPKHFQRLDCEIGNKKLKTYLVKEYFKYFFKIPFGKSKMKR